MPRLPARYIFPVALGLAIALFAAAGLWERTRDYADAANPKSDRATLQAVQDGRFLDFLDQRMVAGDYTCDFAQITHRTVCMSYQGALADRELMHTGVGNPYLQIYRDDPEALLQAVLAMQLTNVVNELISTARYAQLLKNPDFQRPSDNADICFDEGYGICGSHATVLGHLLSIAGIESRLLNFYGRINEIPAGHSTTEAMIGGEWAYLEASWNLFFVHDGRLASVDDIARIGAKNLHLIQDETDLRYVVNRDGYDVFWHLRPGISRTANLDTGTVFIEPWRLGENGIYDLTALPRTIGDIIRNGPYTGVDLHFADLTPDADRVLEIRVEAVAGCKTGDAQLCLGDTCEAVRKGAFSFPLAGSEARLSVRSPEPYCVALLEHAALQ